MKTKPITSAAELKIALARLEPELRKPETEETWDKICKALSSLTDLCNHGACDYPQELIQYIRGLSSPLTSSMMSERTRLSGASIDLISSIASGLGSKFEPLLHIFFPVLLTLCGRATKVFVTRAKSCINTVIESTQLPSIIPYFMQHIKDKSNSIRLASAEGTLACVNCLNPPDLEKDARVRDIEAVIKATATDSQGDIRQIGRKLFEAYKMLFPSRLDSFTDPLTPTIRKYLDIKSSNLPKQEPLPRLLPLEGKKALSSSTSATIGRGRPPVQKPQMHARSTSTSAVSDSTRSTGESDKTVRPEPKKLKPDMPPPPFIPLRTVRSHTELVRNNPEKSTGPSRQPPPAPGQVAASSSSRAPTRGLPQRPPRQDQPQSTSREASRERVAQPMSLPQRTRPQPPAVPSSGQQRERKGAATGPTRTIPSKAPAVEKAMPSKAQVIEKASKPAVPKSTKDIQPPPAAKEPKTRSLTQPTLAQLSRAAAVAKDKPAPSKKPVSRPTQQPVKSSSTSTKPVPVRPRGHTGKPSPAEIPLPPSPKRVKDRKLRKPTPAEVPLPPSPKPVKERKLEESQVVPDETAIEETPGIAGPVEAVASEEDNIPSTPINDDSECAQPEGEEDRPVTPASTQDEADDNREESPEDEVVPSDDEELNDATNSAPTTPIRHAGSSEDLEGLSAKTPISALLNSIQRGFTMSPSEPLSPPQSYIEHKMPAPFPLNAAKGPFIFGRSDDEERPVLNSLENVMNTQTS